MNTRFRPTPYGAPHLGHLMIADMNYACAASTGGKFVLQVDDLFYEIRRYWRMGWPMEKSVAAHVEALTWAGCAPDEVWYSTSNEAEQRKCCEANDVPWLRDGDVDMRWTPPQSPLGNGLCMGMSSVSAPPTAPWYNAVRVADDYTCRIGAFARGFDLAHEHNLYEWFWHRAYGNPAPTQAYFPCLCREGAGQESSSNGSLTVLALRDAGYTPHQLRSSLLAIQQDGNTKQRSAYWVPRGYLTSDEVRPVPHVYDDFAAMIRGGVARNIIDRWADGEGDASGDEWFKDDIAAGAEAFVRDDLQKQGFDPDPFIATILRGECVFDWALANDIRPEAA